MRVLTSFGFDHYIDTAICVLRRDDRREVGLAVELSKLSGPRDRPPGASHDPTIKKQGGFSRV